MYDGRDSESIRRVGAMVLQWGGWAATLGFGLYSVLEYDPNHGNFAPQWLTFVWIVSMGLAIAGTLVRSRMRLTKTILHAFKMGSEAEALREAERKIARIREREEQKRKD